MRLSASTLWRTKACAASSILPQINSSGPEAVAGKESHAFLERVPRIGRDAALERIADPEVRELCESLRLDQLPIGAPYRQEVAYALDALTGKAWEIGESIDGSKVREGLQDWQIPAIADVVGLVGDRVEVYDWKFGFGADVNTQPARENDQLRALAAAAARVFGVRKARVGIIYLPEHRTETHDLDALDLAEVGADLKDLYERLRKAETAHRGGVVLNVRTGPQCRHCPALQHCPSTQALAAQLVATPEVIERDTKALLTAANVPLAYERWRQMKAVTDAVGNALTAWARESPITTVKGTVYGPVFQKRDHVDGNIAFHVIRELHGEDVAGKAVEIATSKAAIERAVKPVVDKGGGAAAMRRILQAVEAQGGLTTTTTEQLREYRLKAAPNELPAKTT